MSYANLTDHEIETLCFENSLSMEARGKLYAQRERDRSVEAALASIEEEMTDACEAESFPPHASPFPTEAQLLNVRRQRKVDMSIAVAADKMSGKTTLLMMIMEMLADAGALPVADTRHITHNMGDYLMSKRYVDQDNVEVIDLDLDLVALLNHIKN
jgi:hypothetical protein